MFWEVNIDSFKEDDLQYPLMLYSDDFLFEEVTGFIFLKKVKNKIKASSFKYRYFKL